MILVRKVSLEIAWERVRKTAAPRFWQRMRIAMAVGIEAREPCSESQCRTKAPEADVRRTKRILSGGCWAMRKEERTLEAEAPLPMPATI